jgi:hypothetical protein
MSDGLQPLGTVQANTQPQPHPLLHTSQLFIPCSETQTIQLKPLPVSGALEMLSVGILESDPSEARIARSEVLLKKCRVAIAAKVQLLIHAHIFELVIFEHAASSETAMFVWLTSHVQPGTLLHLMSCLFVKTFLSTL